MHFATDYPSILKRVQAIDPIAYGTSRNYLNGKVTYLSPYISRGLLSTRQVAQEIIAKGYPTHQIVRLIQELAWRDYFQRVWQQLGDEIFEDIRVNRSAIQSSKIPTSILQASTGIYAIDEGIQNLYTTGYMHNHLRMYVASISCNVGKSHWQLPAQWMYYHLLDGDLGSNTLSWQWVAGTFSSKKYYCNQDNINRFCDTTQTGTFLDIPYAELPLQPIPPILQETSNPTLVTSLPAKAFPVLDETLPTLLYHPYHLDPTWKKDIKANRVLVLEPSHFREHPVSDKVLQFILSLANNIEGIQVFAGEVAALTSICPAHQFYTKEHPAFLHFPGKKEERDWLVPDLKGPFHSFFDFWKKAEKQLFPKASTQQKMTLSITSEGVLSL
jgi:deoxyribodipyrimidine photo-lyase